MLATIVEGKADLADVLFLVAFILFVIGAVICAMEKTMPAFVVAAGLACAALAWFVL